MFIVLKLMATGHYFCPVVSSSLGIVDYPVKLLDSIIKMIARLTNNKEFMRKFFERSKK